MAMPLSFDFATSFVPGWMVRKFAEGFEKETRQSSTVIQLVVTM
jgi:hypothetical protein